MTIPNPKHKNHTSRMLSAATAFGLLVLTLTQPASAQTINPGVIDPTNSYAGKTYSQWAAGFWQYYTSLPATNNPFYQYPAQHDAPLSTGQSGPVWFMVGNYYPGGTYNYTNMIPGGVGLFVAISDVEQGNEGCPPTSYTEAELRAHAKKAEDNVTSMTCTIDGVAVTGLTDVLTTPYRVQSTVFDYTCPAVHNVLHDVLGESCYQNSLGTPYTINGAVEDGVFLLVAPLAAGEHSIQATVAFSGGFSESATRHLIVMPVALTTNVSGQPGHVVLNWPQTPDNYAVQTSPSLSPPDWQPANLVITTNNGILQASASVVTNSQFFRLLRQ